MKRFILPVILLALLLMGCETSVKIKYTNPSEIDMGRARNIAIAPAVPFSGITGGSPYVRFSNFDDVTWYSRSSFSDFFLKQNVANHTTDFFYRTLGDSDYFNILPFEKTVSILNSSNREKDINSAFNADGVDVVLVPNITYMRVDEYIYRKEVDKKFKDPQTGRDLIVKDYVYFLSQNINISVEYSILSVEYSQIVSKRKFNKSLSRDMEIKQYDEALYYDVFSLFSQAIDSFEDELLKQLVPLSRVMNISLLKMNEKDRTLKQAYDGVKHGMLSLSRDIFKDYYDRTGAYEAVYNYALLCAALSDFDEAAASLSDAIEVNNNQELKKLLYRIMKIRELDEKAKNQIEGKGEGFTSDSKINIYQQVMGL